jgi:hypothetical protein
MSADFAALGLAWFAKSRKDETTHRTLSVDLMLALG